MTNESQPVDLKLTRAELLLINNAISEVIHGPDAIAESEFHLRIGASRDEARELLSRIGDSLHSN
jgi:hypothetical protein